MEQVALQDEEWSKDWQAIVKVYESIDKLKETFKELDVPYLREIQQKVLILNLEKYAWTLQNFIVEKYAKERV